jgi:hypothetical protein
LFSPLLFSVFTFWCKENFAKIEQEKRKFKLMFQTSCKISKKIDSGRFFVAISEFKISFCKEERGLMQEFDLILL